MLALQVPVVIVPMEFRLVKLVMLVLVVAVIFPARVAVAALPLIFPDTFEPLTEFILASVTDKSANLLVLIALLAMVGALAVPVRSPDNFKIPIFLKIF